MYSESYQRKIHRHFNHPQPQRTFNLLKRAKDPKATTETLSKLERITTSCDICKLIAEQAGRFRAKFPNENFLFNRLVLIDLMYLEKSPVLHIICKDNLFSVSVFPPCETTEDFWTAYVRF